MKVSSRLLAGALAIGAAAVPATAAAHAGHHHDQKVTIRFAAVAGQTPVSCAAPITGLGTTNATANLQDLRFYISNVRLVTKAGKAVPVALAKNPFNVTKGGNRTTLIDLENGTGSCAAEGDKRTNPVIKGTVPEGDYVGARMYMGVPFPLNHTDIVGAPAPLNLAGLSWAWQLGRKFAKIELADPAGPGGGMMMSAGASQSQMAGAWSSPVFFVHIGSVGCIGNPAAGTRPDCTVSNRMAIRFNRFDPATQKIAIDLKALTAGNDITVNRSGAPGCMSEGTDPECDGVMRVAMGLNWRADGTGTGQPVNHGAAQTLFRVQSR
ncbi:MAG: MbnP family copper-binding protein [Thermoleophilia bacterium]